MGNEFKDRIKLTPKEKKALEEKAKEEALRPNSKKLLNDDLAHTGDGILAYSELKEKE